MSGSAVLSVSGLTVSTRSGTPVVRGADLVVERGEIVGVVGESGSGKTTLCRAVAALLAEGLAVSAGRIAVNGTDVTGLTPAEVHRLKPEGISMVFQDPLAALSPVMRLGPQIVEAIRARRRVDRGAAQRMAVSLLERMGVARPEARVRDYPHQLSGGQRQRAMLAMALASDPVLLLADEPTSALDVTTQRQILTLLRTVAAERGMSVLLVSHDLGVIAEICSRVVVMFGGRIIEEGSTAEVLRSPAHPYTRLLLNALPSVHRRQERLAVIPSGVRAPGPPGSCPFYTRCDRAEDGPCTDLYVHALRRVGVGHSSTCVRVPGAAPVEHGRAEGGDGRR